MWTDTEKNATFRGMRRVRQLATLVVTGKKQLQMFCSIRGSRQNRDGAGGVQRE